MLSATLKYHQGDFQLKLNEKFACAKLALKDSPPLSAIPITGTLPLTS